MKLTVSKYLNARTEKASVNSANPFFREPGFILDIDEVLVGDEIDGNSIWYRSTVDDCYYWSGGVQEVEFEMNTPGLGIYDIKLSKAILSEAKKYYLFKYRNMEGLTGISIADKVVNNKSVGLTALSFQIKAKTNTSRTPIPTTLKFKGFNLNTDIIECKTAEFQISYPGTDTPRRVSGSISRHGLNEWGSCGVKVKERYAQNGDAFVLTNFHVAAPDLLKLGQFNYSLEKGRPPRECVMPAWTYQNNKSNIIGYLYKGLFSNWHDLALIKLADPASVINYTPDNQLLSRSLDVYNDVSYHGLKVTMYSSNTGCEHSTIISTNSSQIFCVKNERFTKENLLQVDRISKGGDSGSPFFLDGKVIGLLIGADDHYSYLIPIQRMLNYFQLELYET